MKNSFFNLKSVCIVTLVLALGATRSVEANPSTNSPAVTVCQSCHGTQKCKRCHGSGQTQCERCQGKGKERDRCSRCGGDGRLSMAQRNRGGVRRSGTCSQCSGRGYRERNCNQCGGDGKVECNKCKGRKACPDCKPKT